jgi:hypothetical protein
LDGVFDEQVVIQKLDDLGYPVAGHNSVVKKAKSYLSCAIGRM